MGVAHKPSHGLADALFSSEDRDARLDDVLNELDIYDSNS